VWRKGILNGESELVGKEQCAMIRAMCSRCRKFKWGGKGGCTGGCE